MVQFAREDAPLSVGIVFDLSGSMKDKLAKSREALVQFLRGANPEDEFCLVEFSNRARLTVPFTTDGGEIVTGCGMPSRMAGRRFWMRSTWRWVP